MEFIPHEIDQDVFVLLADGGINRDNAKVFTEDVESMVANGFNKLIIDCSKLDYISSSGLGTLLVLSKRMKAAGGDVKLWQPQGNRRTSPAVDTAGPSLRHLFGSWTGSTGLQIR